jgi:16S rRNA (cytidine1402-2'-O)-methyltransferase
MAGTLYLVATPIGNLEDVTYRAVRVLQEAHLIACEDTRQTRKLLDRYGIRTPALSYHEHNEAARASQLLAKLQEGMNVALVSDAGTPLVSDPGYRLVTAALEHGIRVEPVPGPSALLAALTASGMPADAFHFAGFLPPKRAQRRKALESLKDESATLVFYEAPHRILETLEDVESVLGPRPTVVAREITKLHEEFLRGAPAELKQTLQERGSVKGEITLLVGKAGEPAADNTPLREAVETCERAGMTRMEAIKCVARRRGLPKSQVYRELESATRTFEPTKA